MHQAYQARNFIPLLDLLELPIFRRGQLFHIDNSGLSRKRPCSRKHRIVCNLLTPLLHLHYV